MSGFGLSNLLTIMSLLLTAASVAYAGRELRQSRRTSQSEFLFNIMTWYLNDPDLRSFFYRLDYNSWRFDENTVSGSDEEPQLDKILFVFDLLGHLVDASNISQENLATIRFEASRVLHNPEVERYLSWLDKEYRQVGQPGPAYAAARRLGERLRTSGIADGTATTFTSERRPVASAEVVRRRGPHRPGQAGRSSMLALITQRARRGRCVPNHGADEGQSRLLSKSTASGIYQMIKDLGNAAGLPISTRTSYGTRFRTTGWLMAGPTAI